MLTINDRLSIPLRELEFSFSRSSGPGGQNVNKVNSKVTLHWLVAASASFPADVRDRFLERYPRRLNTAGQLVITSQRFRDQGRNVADCLDKLRQMVLDVATPPKPRKATRPTRGARERRLHDKRARSEKKQFRRGGGDPGC